MLRPVPKEPRDDDRVFHLGGAHGGGRGEPPVDGPQPTLRPVISPSSVGATLSITREKFGQELKQVAQTLRIKLSYLEAIEDDRYGDLPGLTYAVGFVRSYADYLGLDSRTLVERYKDEAQGLNRKTQLVFPTPAAEAKVPTGAIILVALILVGLTYIGWTYFSDDAQAPAVAEAPAVPRAIDPDPAPAPVPAPVPAAAIGTEGSSVDGTVAPSPEPTAPEPTAAESTAAQSVPAPAPDATAAIASEAPAPAAGTAGLAAAPAASPAAAVPVAPPAPAAATETATTPDAGATAADATQTAMAPPLPPAVEQAHQPRLVIQASQDSWVQIRNAKDEAILTQVLREGESYEVPEEKGLVLLTGNAGGITLVVDGRPLAPLGPVGSVRRNIALDPDGLNGGAPSE